MRSTFSACSCSLSLCAVGRLGVTSLGNGFSLFRQSLVITSSFLSGMGLCVQVPFSMLGFVSFFFSSLLCGLWPLLVSCWLCSWGWPGMSDFPALSTGVCHQTQLSFLSSRYQFCIRYLICRLVLLETLIPLFFFGAVLGNHILS